MTVTQDVEAGLSVAFHVKVDRLDLGMFSACEGLGAEVVMEQREEGGFNTAVWQLPSRLKYPNIKLTRVLGKGTTQITDWLAEVADGRTFSQGTIQALAAGDSKKVIAEWHLLDVVPVRWTGPSFQADSPKVLTEILELAHHGFLKGGS